MNHILEETLNLPLIFILSTAYIKLVPLKSTLMQMYYWYYFSDFYWMSSNEEHAGLMLPLGKLVSTWPS